MRRILTTLVTTGLVLALATPATLSAATDRDETGPAKIAAEPTIVTAKPPLAAPVLLAPSIRASIDRARAAIIASAPSAAQAPAPVTRRSTTRIRAQGGGKSGMIIGLVSTVIGLGATVYMMKMMQKANETKTD